MSTVASAVLTSLVSVIAFGSGLFARMVLRELRDLQAKVHKLTEETLPDLRADIAVLKDRRD